MRQEWVLVQLPVDVLASSGKRRQWACTLHKFFANLVELFCKNYPGLGL